MTREQIEKTMKQLNYTYFTNGDFNFNIIGIRNSTTNKITNKFDDKITLSFKENNIWQYYEWQCTTDPGTYYTKNLLDKKGVAILVPGQYKSTYTIRKHQGKYDALCQLNKVKVYRDDNKNDIYDFNSKTINEGIFGINIHKSGTDSMLVDKWSAGCQVFKREKDFNLFMSLIKKQKTNRYTYTLIESKDIK